MASIVSSLRPYPGKVVICSRRKDFYREHRQRFGCKHDPLGTRKGRMIGQLDQEEKRMVYLVWADSPAVMSHELAHVILDVFEMVGIDPISGNGEAFCYLLSQLMQDAGHG